MSSVDEKGSAPILANSAWITLLFDLIEQASFKTVMNKASATVVCAAMISSLAVCAMPPSAAANFLQVALCHTNALYKEMHITEIHTDILLHADMLSHAVTSTGHLFIRQGR